MYRVIVVSALAALLGLGTLTLLARPTAQPKVGYASMSSGGSGLAASGAYHLRKNQTWVTVGGHRYVKWEVSPGQFLYEAASCAGYPTKGTPNPESPGDPWMYIPAQLEICVQ